MDDAEAVVCCLASSFLLNFGSDERHGRRKAGYPRELTTNMNSVVRTEETRDANAAAASF